MAVMNNNKITYDSDYKVLDRLVYDARGVDKKLYVHIKVTQSEIMALARITKSRNLPVYRYNKSSNYLVADIPIYYIETVYMWCNLGRPMTFDEFYFGIRGAHAPPGDGSLPNSLLENN